MAFGYDTTTGWNPVTYISLLADVRAKYKAQTSENVDVVNGPAADMIRTVTLIGMDLWNDALGGYNSGFVSAAPGTNGVAEGSALEVLLTPRIGPKLAAASSTVTVPLLGTPATVIPAGVSIVIEGESGTWTLDVGVVIGGGGTVDGEWTYSETGPKLVAAASDWTITTPVTGWDSVGPNAADGIPGRDVETDDEYRLRYTESLRDSIIAAVRGIDGVSGASMIEWQLGTPDGYWGLTHWFEVLVTGGDDTEIATAIEATRAQGTKPIGNQSVVLTDSKYATGEVTIGFSRAVLVPCYATVAVTKGEGYSVDTSPDAITARENLIKAAIVAYFAQLDPGEDTSAFKVAVEVINGSGIAGIDSLVVVVDIIDPPVNTGTIAANIRDQLTIATADIDVTGA